MSQQRAGGSTNDNDNDNENILYDNNIQNLYNRSTIVYKPEHELGLETTIKTNKFVAIILATNKRLLKY